MCWKRMQERLAGRPEAERTPPSAPQTPQDAPQAAIPPAVVQPPAPARRPVGGIYPDLEQRVSPNAGAAFAAPPDTLVIHFTASGTATSALQTFADTTPGKRVSAHFIVARDGWTCQCVRVTRQAWHAGESKWAGRTGANGWALGIELVNWGKLRGVAGKWVAWTGTPVPDEQVKVVGGNGWQAFPPAQLEAAAALCRRLCRDFPISLVLGHDEISPTRKSDPGPAFPLNELRRALGLATIGNRR